MLSKTLAAGALCFSALFGWLPGCEAFAWMIAWRSPARRHGSQIRTGAPNLGACEGEVCIRGLLSADTLQTPLHVMLGQCCLLA